VEKELFEQEIEQEYQKREEQLFKLFEELVDLHKESKSMYFEKVKKGVKVAIAKVRKIEQAIKVKSQDIRIAMLESKKIAQNIRIKHQALKEEEVKKKEAL